MSKEIVNMLTQFSRGQSDVFKLLRLTNQLSKTKETEAANGTSKCLTFLLEKARLVKQLIAKKTDRHTDRK